MKYVVKWNNGFWKVFDTVQYSDIMICNLKTEADNHCKKLNEKQ